MSKNSAQINPALTRLGGSPEMALRNALAEIERDAALSTAPATMVEWKPASR